jgi:Cu2+-containing amine oxidase
VVLEGKPIRREAFIVLLDRDHNKTNEVIVDLEGNAVKSWKTIRTYSERRARGVRDRAGDHRRIRVSSAMRKRGITIDRSNDAWAPGYLGRKRRSSRIVRAIFFYKNDEDSNGTAAHRGRGGDPQSHEETGPRCDRQRRRADLEGQGLVR